MSQGVPPQPRLLLPYSLQEVGAPSPLVWVIHSFIHSFIPPAFRVNLCVCPNRSLKNQEACPNDSTAG